VAITGSLMSCAGSVAHSASLVKRRHPGWYGVLMEPMGLGAWQGCSKITQVRPGNDELFTFKLQAAADPQDCDDHAPIAKVQFDFKPEFVKARPGHIALLLTGNA
jgi:hypothetical protein